jgi:hypothetical protein
VAKAQEDAFDVLTFYIYVMALLTAIVGGFALWNKKKVDGEVTKIKNELDRLERMRALAIKDDLRGWIARERGNRDVGTGGAADFQALYLKRGQESGVRITTHSSQGTREMPGGTELSYRLQIDGCRVENLVKFLVRVEEEWPGAKTKQIAKLDWNEKNQAWDAIIELCIFRASS